MSLKRISVTAILLAMLVQGCSWGHRAGEGEESALEEREEESPLPRVSDRTHGSGKASAHSKAQARDEELTQVELKQARLWARLDELEGLVLRQQEKVKLLEQGLLLGLVPAKLQAEQGGARGRELSPSPAPLGEGRGLLVSPARLKAELEADLAVNSPPAADEGVAKAADVFKKRIALAQKFYQEGRYGQAYLEFSRMEREFDASIAAGEPAFWIGRCWLKLKEYGSAKQYFSDFISQHSASPWLATAKYHLAETELAMGMRENAARELQALMKQHPYEATAEAAKQLLDNMAKTL